MDLAGDYQLAALTIGAPVTGQEQTPITGLVGMSAVTLEAELKGGSGGSAVTALVRSRISTGGTWREIARFDFTTGDSKSCTIAAGTGADIASLGTLSANAVLQGFLGTDLEVVITSTGTYTDTTLSVRAAVR